MRKTLDIEVEKWATAEGNKCFRFPMRESFERPWIIAVVAGLLVAGCLMEFLVNKTYYALLPSLLILFFATVWWIAAPLKSNERIREKAIHELMDGWVADDAKAVGAEVQKTKVQDDIKGTYGIVTASCLLVLLNNGQVWEYPILYHHPEGDQPAYFECNRSRVISENENHIRSINPQRWSRFASRFKMSGKVKMGTLIAVILLIGGLFFSLVFWMIYKWKWWTILIVGCYLALYGVTKWISGKLPGKAMDCIKTIVSFPAFFAVGLIQPFITIVGTYFFLGAFAFGVPAVILTALTNCFNWGLKPEAIVFLVLAAGSILCANSYATTKWLIHQTPLRDWGNHTYESYREALAVYLIRPNNIVFVLYLLYFILLAVSGYLQIQKGVPLFTEGFDAAILKAFLVFIAFTNMRTKADLAEMDLEGLLKRTLLLFVHDKE